MTRISDVVDGDQPVDQILIKLILASMLTGVVQSSQASKTSEIEVDDKEARAKLTLEVSTMVSRPSFHVGTCQVLVSQSNPTCIVSR